MRILATLAAAASVLCFAAAPTAAQPTLDFPDFDDCSSLQLNGSATCTGGVLRLTPTVNSQVGSAFTGARTQLLPGAAFSSFFEVNIHVDSPSCGDSDGEGADGLAFILQPVAATAIGGLGGFLGYEGIPSSAAVELDTWDNSPGFADPDGNHIGIDLAGSVISVATAPVATRLNDGTPWYVWVDYDGATLEARIAPTPTRPASPTVFHVVDLEAALGGTLVYAGFGAGTGGCAETHDIVRWQLDAYQPQTLVDVPTLSTAGLAALALALLLVAGFALRRRTA